MAYVLDKLKSFFASNTSSLLHGKKRSAVLSYVRTDLDPTQIWQNVEPIGDGAFGKIYKAVHKTSRRLAALKQVEVATAEELEDHAVEITILTQLSHKNIVQLIEAFHFDGKLWIYLEYCAGGAVDRIMYELERPLTEPQICCICRQVCEGLAYLHGNGVIHRDLKASNLLLTDDGRVKLG